MSFNIIPSFSLPEIIQRDPTAIKLLHEALTDHGFFTITDHGISDELLSTSYNLSKNFFDLPEATKSAYAFPQKAGARGYTPFGKETALGETTPDLKEFWHHGPAIDSTYDARILSNINVTEINQFNSNFNSLFSALNELGMIVLSAIATILDKDPAFFDGWVQKGNSVLRLIHYPPVTDASNTLRARAHEDINLITLLVGAEESGLEVKNQQGNWIPISAKSKSIVCNIGDMMQLVTRSQLKSTTHRVIDHNTESSASRYSMPFFLHPSPDIELGSIVDDSPESISAHEFLEERLRAIKLY
ncbi:MAG: 2OG-Fe(II) oxygenase [SAR86 cluster bacterium BACL1 MAG-120920-bin57]|jgi:isopenicillin N synthase-like dioxygenase|uniref:2-oxoglutarate-dependent ethylene/succinate-forming enzyme n=2 Tax=SAR86 cluster TaxID=62672 RepID=A0A0R2UD37_9GAMM|nr:MAG: 2OG-Fe(II) oxygenase [SAR86 cluster bacterium BACL1 MAG-120507-bin14]KRO39279.1 MAG: 2OG-Fe(II) oxygenase [SAR86 cluster bacterium BACL1 MAG-120920-bin57]KRO95088.1 MAG: 2OG-Fe(II) oxygenase [SAR86 cluster bacterium BACL1 MAG-120820-bin45]KRO97948.1 MAG: 2OG-Fe(II) oxygenase [SAR86 cluster bacterium BACL1 MAG-120823-bin87]KRP00736.1 MAG: 2OG-Fe(II) oxygenase [SAR86 cluster bacterium BACL1 MAG-120924-bin88]KRP01235.1 MAG: 2OG-Fe(II) oxygenase [SAR86 cluster bacterium BACL1 MAG-120619-bi